MAHSGSDTMATLAALVIGEISVPGDGDRMTFPELPFACATRPRDDGQREIDCSRRRTSCHETSEITSAILLRRVY